MGDARTVAGDELTATTIGLVMAAGLLSWCWSWSVAPSAVISGGRPHHRHVPEPVDVAQALCVGDELVALEPEVN